MARLAPVVVLLALGAAPLANSEVSSASSLVYPRYQANKDSWSKPLDEAMVKVIQSDHWRWKREATRDFLWEPLNAAVDHREVFAELAQCVPNGQIALSSEPMSTWRERCGLPALPGEESPSQDVKKLAPVINNTALRTTWVDSCVKLPVFVPDAPRLKSGGLAKLTFPPPATVNRTAWFTCVTKVKSTGSGYLLRTDLPSWFCTVYCRTQNDSPFII